MSRSTDSSRTMRIDLIPDVPNRPRDDQREAVIVGAPAREGRGSTVADPAAEITPYQRLLQRLYDAAVIANLDGHIVDVNVRAEDFFGYPKTDFKGLSVFSIISGADEDLIQTLCQNLEGERYTLIQAYCIRADGTNFPAEIAVSKLELNGTHLCFFVRDITVRRQAEEMLITEHNAIQNSGNGIAVINQDGTIEFVNPMVEQMWACEPDALLGVDLRDLVSNRDVADELLRVLTEGGAQNWAGEATARRADGSEFDVQINGARNRNPDGETLGCVLSFMDIGDRKRAREAERQAEQHRVMLESLGAACHHVSQPATMLMGNLEMLMERLNEYDEASQLLIKRSLVAVEEVSRVLKRLTAVSEYKTMQYLGGEGGGSGTDSRILEI